MDIEGNPLLSSATTRPVENPYASDAGQKGRRLFLMLQRLVYISISLFGLKHFALYQVVLHSPHVSHEWFKVGLASTIALLGVKAYVEIYEGRIQKATVHYKTFPQSTHAALALILFSSLAYHIALWPHYHWNTIIVLGLTFFGVIIPFILLTPSWIQNIVSFVGLAFFLQEYS